MVTLNLKKENKKMVSFKANESSMDVVREKAKENNVSITSILSALVDAFANNPSDFNLISGSQPICDLCHIPFDPERPGETVCSECRNGI